MNNKKKTLTRGSLTELLIPVVAFLLPVYAVEFVYGLIWALTHFAVYTDAEGNIMRDAMMEMMTQVYTENAMLLQGIGALIAIIILTAMYKKDVPKRAFWYDKTGIPAFAYILPVLIGIAYSFSGNLILNAGNFAESSKAFEEAQTLLFSGPVVIQFLTIGVIIPISEELFHRGLIFMRLRQYTNVNHAIGVSALIFAVFHGNIVQGIYGFIMGVILAYAYEKYGSILVCILMHISANLFSLIFASVAGGMGQLSDPFLIGFGLAGAAACCMLLWIMDRKVSCRLVRADAEI